MSVRRLSREELTDALVRAGVCEGDLVHVQSDLRTLGPVEAEPGREAMLEFYLGAFREVLGPAGTLTVYTFFEDYGRYGTPFDRESSPSSVGAFSEYVRTRPAAVRSLHPVMSVAALGARAEEICGGTHFDALGYDSPWARLHRANAKLVSLGLRFRDSLTFAHYIESLYGVPYKYTKLFRAPVLAGGEEIPGPFTMSVRYLDFSIEHDVAEFERRLLAAGAAVEVPLGRSLIQCGCAGDVVRVGVECLNEDRYFFLARPPRFREGEYPADGPTGEMRLVYEERP